MNKDRLLGADQSAGAGLVRLDEAIAAVDPYLRESVIPTGRIINLLLDVWDAAHSIAADVSSPVEQLLTTLLTRHLITPAELVAFLDNVRIAALQATVLFDEPATA